VLRAARLGRTPEQLEPLADTETVKALISLTARVHLADPLYAYAVRWPRPPGHTRTSGSVSARAAGSR